MFGNIGMSELLLIFLVILLVFGAKRIPEIARGMGKGIREFKDASKDIKRELNLEDTNDYYRVQAPQQGTTMPRTDTYAQPQEAAPTTQNTPTENREYPG